MSDPLAILDVSWVRRPDVAIGAAMSLRPARHGRTSQIAADFLTNIPLAELSETLFDLINSEPFAKLADCERKRMARTKFGHNYLTKEKKR